MSTAQIITVPFRNDTLFAVEREDGIFVAIKPIADSLGIDWRSQRQKIEDDPVLSEGRAIITLPSAGGAQETACLRLDLVNGWLFKIDSRRVGSDETRDKLIAYQRECYATLFAHFYGKAADPIDDDQDMPLGHTALKVRMVAEARQAYGPRSAAELWMNLGLPVTTSMRREMYRSTPEGERETYAERIIKIIKRHEPHGITDAAMSIEARFVPTVIRAKILNELEADGVIVREKIKKRGKSGRPVTLSRIAA